VNQRLLDDLARWETGAMSTGTLASRHPEESLAPLLEMHGQLVAFEAPAPDVEASWAALRERLPERKRPLQSPMATLRRWAGKPLVAIATTGVLSTGAASAAGLDPVRDAVDTIGRGVARVIGVEVEREPEPESRDRERDRQTQDDGAAPASGGAPAVTEDGPGSTEDTAPDGPRDTEATDETFTGEAEGEATLSPDEGTAGFGGPGPGDGGGPDGDGPPPPPPGGKQMPGDKPPPPDGEFQPPPPDGAYQPPPPPPDGTEPPPPDDGIQPPPKKPPPPPPGGTFSGDGAFSGYVDGTASRPQRG
jgi:hypothetical protein